MTSPPSPTTAALAALLALVDRLRNPGGCPWDQAQTLASAAPFLLEEASEAVEAIEAGNVPEALAELGDVSFQVAFLARLFAERGDFDLAGVFSAATAKMIRRHPHVFAGEKLADAEAVLARWAEIKAAERKAGDQGLLDGIPLQGPALTRAQRLGKRAGRVGFDWAGAPEVWAKVAEEQVELAAATTAEEEAAELGDLFFALAQWARHRGIDAEAALRAANRRFTSRFRAMEELARARGLDLAALDPAGQDALWEEVKAAPPPAVSGQLAALTGGEEVK